MSSFIHSVRFYCLSRKKECLTNLALYVSCMHMRAYECLSVCENECMYLWVCEWLCSVIHRFEWDFRLLPCSRIRFLLLLLRLCLYQKSNYIQIKRQPISSGRFGKMQTYLDSCSDYCLIISIFTFVSMLFYFLICKMFNC